MLIPFGFLASAGGAAGAYELISTTLVTSDVTSVTLTSGGVWANYKHLQLRFTAKSSSTSADNFSLKMQFNSDATSAYATHALYAGGLYVSSLSDPPADALISSNAVVSNASGQTSKFGAGIFDILDSNSTFKNTTVRVLGGGLGSKTIITLSSGLWEKTDAVTSLKVYAIVGNLMAGSRFSLYGIKG